MGFDLGAGMGILGWPPRCPACTAPLDRRKERCEYCRTPVRRIGPMRVEKSPAPDKPPSALPQPPSEPDAPPRAR